MVTLQIASDLHLEHRGAIADYRSIVEPRARVLALVGDIGSPFDPKLADFISYASANWSQVLYVPGNHEYYSSNHRMTMSEIERLLLAICSRHSNVRLLLNETFELDNVMFIGSTLWSFVPPEKWEFVQARLNDYNLIYTEAGLLTPQLSNELFQTAVQFIQSSVNDARRRGKKAVVLTHHVPSTHETSPPQYVFSHHGFATSLPANHDPGAIRLWCAGHTHHNFHHKKEGYELISNQLGYGSNASYNKALVIEL